jgi:hypothetical protein
MNRIGRVISFVFGRRKSGAPVIMTQYGPVTESARLQAALNMRDSLEIRNRVIAILEREFGSAEMALSEAKKRYPEAWE